jgi:peptide/nickel transport system permease protein
MSCAVPVTTTAVPDGPSGARSVTRRPSLTRALQAAAVALVPRLFASGSPTAVNPIAALLGPSGQFPLGTDQYGRSIYTELVYGARPALEVGVACTVLGGVVGSVIGIIGGYLGGWVDTLVMRLIDILLALPGLLLALIFIAALPRTLTNEILAISISTIPIFARVMHGQALQVRSRPFIDAATVTGVRRGAVVWRHVVPNCMTPAIVLAAVYVGVVIVVAASLNFLGLGPSEGVLDWGALISSGQGYIDKDWCISVFPGLTVALLVIAVSIIGGLAARRAGAGPWVTLHRCAGAKRGTPTPPGNCVSGPGPKPSPYSARPASATRPRKRLQRPGAIRSGSAG